MRRFLSAIPAGDQAHEITIGDSAEAVGRGGLVSPVFSAFGVELDAFDGTTSVLLCFPDDSTSLLGVIQNELPKGLRSRTMLSYGLASVLIIGEAQELRDIATSHRHLLNAWELWPLENGRLAETAIERDTNGVARAEFDPISADGLPYDAACQVRQLNVNLAFALNRASLYTPELTGAFVAIAQAAGALVDELRSDAERARSLDEVRKHHYYLSRVLEVNAGLAMVISQTLGGTPPLLASEYPVGEYGLLGIGAASRALWAFYFHLRRCFLSANHGSRIAQNGELVKAFDPFINWNELDYSTWSAAAARLTNLPPADGPPPAPHLLHYSSRFGFHETEYTLGASWQSLHASSSREWHLLTVTHEYIHSQVRQITAAIFPAATDWERLSDLVRGDEPSNALEAMQVACFQGMARYAAARDASATMQNRLPRLVSDGYNGRPTPSEARAIIAHELRQFQEIAVHVLDYLYTFHGESRTYLAAIWQSWSTVPSVTERIHDYLLRSLCALSATSIAPDRNANIAFKAVLATATADLKALGDRFESPVVDRALEYVSDGVGQRRLELEFSQAYYIARFAKDFLFDPEVATELSADDLTAIGGAGGRRYVFEPGEYPNEPVTSPLAFLSDRFEHETLDAGPDLEFASLWQLLLTTSPLRGDW